jgi:S1-C subfamily serine protease
VAQLTSEVIRQGFFQGYFHRVFKGVFAQFHAVEKRHNRTAAFPQSRLIDGFLIAVKVVQVDAVNDLALLKADGRFAPLPIAASRTVALGGTVATIGFPDIGLQGFAPKLAA